LCSAFIDSRKELAGDVAATRKSCSGKRFERVTFVPCSEY